MARRALVTGSSRGLGREIALALEDAGLDVIGTARNTPDWATEGSNFFAVDLADPVSTRLFSEHMSTRSVDVLVNNAGINRISPFVNIDECDFRDVLEVNLISPMLLSRALLPHMQRSGWGRIINISSVLGHISMPQRGAYSASKAGLDGMTKALAAEVAHQGILVNSVSPGICETDLTREVLGADGIAAISERIPIGRLGEPREIASVVRFLASDEASYISGQSIVVDGGFVNV
jgi:NAD(P)-dependent dehydrogenase (short-subunit alcohol dehydrogenase family)